jgi:hypothetical protein
MTRERAIDHGMKKPHNDEKGKRLVTAGRENAFNNEEENDPAVPNEKMASRG